MSSGVDFDKEAIQLRLDAAKFEAHPYRGAITWGALTAGAIATALVVAAVVLPIFTGILAFIDLAVLGLIVGVITCVFIYNKQNDLSNISNASSRVHDAAQKLMKFHSQEELDCEACLVELSNLQSIKNWVPVSDSHESLASMRRNVGTVEVDFYQGLNLQSSIRLDAAPSGSETPKMHLEAVIVDAVSYLEILKAHHNSHLMFV